MDYSKTVNLPTTDFPMRANLPVREPELLELWEKEGLYKKIQESRKDAELYILHDGPPYANGNIHLGHALNKILKDIIIKHKTMMGFRVPYVPGWDCHGLPIELNVTKELGDKARTASKDEIRKGCREYAARFVTLQRDQFKRLGVLADYANPYLTMSGDYEAKIVEVFADILEKGYIYRSKKPIYWCPNCVTALAEAEVEYENHTSSSIYVKFPVRKESAAYIGESGENVSVIIWTTTPWTIPANLAVCFHPDFDYAAYKFGSEYYVLARGLVEQFAAAVGQTPEKEVLLSIEQVENLTVDHPFIERESKVIFGDHVTLEQGTGIVHTAPGHGQEDYLVGLKYGLEAFCPVDDNGCYTEDFAPMKGVHVFKANGPVIDIMKNNGTLIKSESFEHSYPHCWRCKKPLIFRATEQWFFSIDHDNIREKALDTIEKTKWVPSWGEMRFRGMAETRPDWCLSRQRSWGVPIPSFRCEKCGNNMMSAESVKHFARLSRERSIDIWYTEDIKSLIPDGTKCSCGSDSFVKEYDILDVWFDSGVSHFAVLDNRADHRWPADMYLEGSDQHRGWFQSSLWPALAIKGRAPYSTVLTHGFVLDEKGKAMSKSMGNVIAPEKLISQFGADILRMWVSSEDYRNDVRIGMDMVKQAADSYRRIRNTFKFIIGNIHGFSAEDRVNYSDMSDIDRWMLHELSILSDKVIAHYENYEFHMVYKRLQNFCAVELSSIYFDISKDILYVEEKNDIKRRANLTVQQEIFNVLVRLTAPLLAFTSEEVWKFEGGTGSIHEQHYYRLDTKYNNSEVKASIDRIVDIKKDVLKSLEVLRRDKTIRGSLEADIKIFVNDESARKKIEMMGGDFKRFLQVAAVELVDSSDESFTKYEKCSIYVSKTQGKKCARCWNYFSELGSDSGHPELCARCTDIVKKIGEVSE